MMFAMVACSYDDVTMPHEVPTDGTTLLNFSVQVPDMQQATRSMASQKITKLDLVVFDEQGYFVEVAHAKVSNSESWNDAATPANPAAEQKYSVELLQSAAPRIIHFIANSPVDSYSYGSERELINALETSGSADAYWQRIELNSILGDVVSDDGKVTASPDSELAQELNQIPLVRNFAKVTVTKAEAVTDAIFGNVQIAVYNAPQRGKVAPYNTNAGEWADYNTTTTTYATLTAAKYYGYEATGLGSEDGDFANTEFGTVQYMYEYNMDGKKIEAGSKYPFVIIEGKYLNNNTSYYKVDLVDADGNYYNILRNFNYNVIIDKVSGDGYPTAAAAAAAAASNNISASIDTQNLLNISDGVSRLYVEYTSKYITTTEPVTLKYKYVPDINNPTVTNNAAVKLSGFTGGDVLQDTYTNASGTVDSDGWSTITVTPKSDIDGTEDQKVTLSASTLSRTVTFYWISAYQLAIDCPEEVAASVGASMTATLTIPENLPEAIFPLEFVIVSDKLSISPDATQENMPVKTNLKANGQEGGQFFGFVKTLEYENYVERGDDGKITGYNTSIDCHFKTSIAASASTVSVYNPYFTAASDSFENSEPEYWTGSLSFTATAGSNFATNSNTTIYIYRDASRNNQIGSVSLRNNNNNRTKTVTIQITEAMQLTENSMIYFYGTRSSGGTTYTCNQSATIASLNGKSITLDLQN